MPNVTEEKLPSWLQAEQLKECQCFQLQSLCSCFHCQERGTEVVIAHKKSLHEDLEDEAVFALQKLDDIPERSERCSRRNQDHNSHSEAFL